MLVAVADESGELIGYGAWIHAEADLNGDLIDVIRVIRFGVGLGYKGQLDPDTGRKYAELLYAAVEQDAIASSEPVTPIELFCDAENGRGLQFWQRRGFTLIDVRPAGSRSYARFIAPGGVPGQRLTGWRSALHRRFARLRARRARRATRRASGFVANRCAIKSLASPW